MGSIRQLKRSKSAPAPSPLNTKLMEAWQRGFDQGVKKQRESDIQTLVDLLNGIENVLGFGPKTVEKIQRHFADKFGWEE